MDGDGDVIEREEPLSRRVDGQRPGDREGHARHRLECRQRGEREHRHHDLSQVVRVDRVDTERKDRGDRHGEAELNHEGRRRGQAGVATLQRVGLRRQCLDVASRGDVGAEGQQFGRAGQRVDDAGGEMACKVRDLTIAAAPPGEQCRDDECHHEGDPECDRGPRQDQADRYRAEHARADCDRHGQHRAQVEVLEGVDVVDGPAQEVAAPPPGQRGRDTRGQAVVEPDAPAGEGPQRRIVPDKTLGVAKRPAQEGEHLDEGQDAHERAQARPQGCPADDVPRTGEEADGRRRRRQPE